MKIVILIIIAILILAELINICSYQYFRAQVGGRAQLRIIRPVEDSRTMNYLCPGFLGDVKTSFAFAFEKLWGGITAVNYVNTSMKPQAIARQIIDDVKANNYHGVIVAISCGEQIAYHLHEYGEQIDIISINPCANSWSLQSSKRFWLRVLLPAANILGFLAGWGAYKTTLSVAGSKYSASLALSQLNNIAYSNGGNDGNRHNTWGIILSRNDELLDNRKLFKKFGFLPPPNVAVIDTCHGDTINQAELYGQALERLLVDVY